jgi:hypothetical protein
MRTLILLLIGFTLYVNFLSAQGKYDHYWVFADSLGLDFRQQPLPAVVYSNIQGPQIPTASICDKDGNLSCYIGTWKWADFEVRLFNKFHTLVKNGNKLIKEVNGVYTQYGGFVQLLPINLNFDTLILVQNASNHLSNKFSMYSSIVDMHARGDSGEIFSLNNLIYNYGSKYGIKSMRHANGRDWWVITHEYPGDAFYIFSARPDGLQLVYKQHIGGYHGLIDSGLQSNSILGEMSVNLNGNLLCTMASDGLIEVFDFDRCTGTLSNPVTLQNPGVLIEDLLTISANISPSGRFVYASTSYKVSTPLGFAYRLKIVQHDVQNPQDTVVLWEGNGPDHLIVQFEYGPDGKMWFNGYSDVSKPQLIYPQKEYLHFIEFPEVKGVGCNLKFNQLYLGGRRAISGMPNMPNYNLGPLVGSPCDTLALGRVQALDVASQLSLYPVPADRFLRIRTTTQVQPLQVKISDMTGRICHQQLWPESEHSLYFNTQNLPSGLYIARIQTRQGEIQKKFVIER